MGNYYDPPDYDVYCEVCFGSVESLGDGQCICPVCDICGETGNINCYGRGYKTNHGLSFSEEVKGKRIKAFKIIEEERKRDYSYNLDLANEWQSQSYYWTDEWQAKEKRADEDLRLGRHERFESIEDFINKEMVK